MKGTRLICEVLGHQWGSDEVIQEGEAANRSLLSRLLSSAGKLRGWGNCVSLCSGLSLGYSWASQTRRFQHSEHFSLLKT